MQASVDLGIDALISYHHMKNMQPLPHGNPYPNPREASLCPMNFKKIEPDFNYIAERLSEVIGQVKQDSLEPIVKTFMESLEFNGYTDSQILNSIGDYYYSKDAKKYEPLVSRLEKTVVEARIINGETVLFD